MKAYKIHAAGYPCQFTHFVQEYTRKAPDSAEMLIGSILFYGTFEECRNYLDIEIHTYKYQ